MRGARLTLWALLLLSCGEQRVELFDACATCGEAGTVDITLRDPERCGVEMRHCEDEEYCVAGACVCRPPLTRIGDDCVDTASDAEHCGGEGRVCALCVAGACGSTCGPGTVECDGGCVDTETHPRNCGECGRPCGAGELCVGGLCTDFRPAACSGCPCDCVRACCAYPGHPSDTICLDADGC